MEMNTAYHEQIFDESTQKWIPLHDKVSQIEAEVVPDTGDIVSSTMLLMYYHPALSTVPSPGTDWFSDNAGIAGLRLIEMPSLASLGFDTHDGYSLRATPWSVIGAEDADMEFRVLEIGTSNIVSSKSQSFGAPAIAGQDMYIELPAFTPEAGKQYYVDVKQVDATAPATGLRRYGFLLQVIQN